MPASAIVTPSELMITYFQAASSERALPSSPTSAALARVLASTSTNSRPRLPVSSEASIRDGEQAEEDEVQPDLEARSACPRPLPPTGRRPTRAAASRVTPATVSRKKPLSESTYRKPAQPRSGARCSWAASSAMAAAERDERARRAGPGPPAGPGRRSAAASGPASGPATMRISQGDHPRSSLSSAALASASCAGEAGHEHEHDQHPGDEVEEDAGLDDERERRDEGDRAEEHPVLDDQPADQLGDSVPAHHHGQRAEQDHRRGQRYHGGRHHPVRQQLQAG